MRTNLSAVMKSLLNGILDPYIFHGGDYANVNQLTFFTSVFPLYFLNSAENQQILQTNKSNSSRLSNLFTRQLDPKRKEPKFRDRFTSSFDAYFLDDMLLSSRFLLRNYQKAAFDKWIHRLLLEDVDLLTNEHLFFYKNISSSYRDKPHLALTLIVLWAFYVDDFKPLIDVFEQHPILNTPYSTRILNRVILTCKVLISQLPNCFKPMTCPLMTSTIILKLQSPIVYVVKWVRLPLKPM